MMADYLKRKLYSYSSNALKRGQDITITYDQLKDLIADSCHYCGAYDDPNGVRIGLDRIDNSEGYHIFNVVPACTTCNRMKLAMSIKTFLNHVARIHNNLSN